MNNSPARDTQEVLGAVRRAIDQVAEVVLRKVPTAVKFFNPDCPPNLATFVTNLLEKAPQSRYADRAAVLAGLRAVRAGAEIERTKKKA